MQSEVIQHFRKLGIEIGIEKGARENAIENTIAVLNARFPDADITAVNSALEAIQNLERLKALNLNASLTSTFEDFLHTLNA